MYKFVKNIENPDLSPWIFLLFLNQRKKEIHYIVMLGWVLHPMKVSPSCNITPRVNCLSYSGCSLMSWLIHTTRDVACSKAVIQEIDNHHMFPVLRMRSVEFPSSTSCQFKYEHSILQLCSFSDASTAWHKITITCDEWNWITFTSKDVNIII